MIKDNIQDLKIVVTGGGGFLGNYVVKELKQYNIKNILIPRSKEIDLRRRSNCLKITKNADLVIIEDTVSNFSTGHQITLALEMQKPTLVLWKGQKHKHFNQMFILGRYMPALFEPVYDAFPSLRVYRMKRDVPTS